MTAGCEVATRLVPAPGKHIELAARGLTKTCLRTGRAAGCHRPTWTNPAQCSSPACWRPPPKAVPERGEVSGRGDRIRGERVELVVGGVAEAGLCPPQRFRHGYLVLPQREIEHPHEKVDAPDWNRPKRATAAAAPACKKPEREAVASSGRSVPVIAVSQAASTTSKGGRVPGPARRQRADHGHGDHPGQVGGGVAARADRAAASEGGGDAGGPGVEHPGPPGRPYRPRRALGRPAGGAARDDRAVVRAVYGIAGWQDHHGDRVRAPVRRRLRRDWPTPWAWPAPLTGPRPRGPGWPARCAAGTGGW